MRKRIDPAISHGSALVAEQWLDLVSLAEIEITSEDPAHPIEAALIPGTGSGWRASTPGTQTIRVIFDEPRALRHIHLAFTEDETPRTQEFVLRWSSGDSNSSQEIVRQQYNFIAGSSEVEEYVVELNGVKTVELEIIPSIGGGDIYASLTELCFR